MAAGQVAAGAWLFLALAVGSARGAEPWETSMSGAAAAYEEHRLADAEVALREAIAEAEQADLEGLGVAAGLDEGVGSKPTRWGSEG